MPPSTGQLTILLIIIKLAESGVLGDLLEGLSGQCDAAMVRFEGSALRDKAFRLPYGGHIHPRRGQGDGTLKIQVIAKR